MVHQVKSKAELEKQFKDAGDKLVVVDFFATWCGPCKRIAPLLDEMAALHKDTAVFLKVDVDEVEELVAEYSIQVMPTFVFLKNGETLEKLPGSNEGKLQTAVAKYLSA